MKEKMKEIYPGIYKIVLGEPEKGTPVSLRRTWPDEEHLNKSSDKDVQIPFEAADIIFQTNKRGCVIELPLDESEQIFGFGLQLKSFRQNGKKKTVRVNADPIADTGDSHAPVPFYVSSKGYGVLVDTARYVSFYCGNIVTIAMDKTGGVKLERKGNYSGEKYKI